MNGLKIKVEAALQQRDRGALLIDTRTPEEFAEATIPGAVNVPLFSNEERARVGTVYHREGAAAARLLSVDLVAPRIPALVREVMGLCGDDRSSVIVFCWRGGERSRAVATFLRLAGISARQLEGGHKAFRAYVRQYFERGQWGRLLVLRGLTGVGKTRFLLKLRDRGHPVIDLEGLANHRGSAFGALGCAPQPSQKMFEALLWDELRHVGLEGYALAEGESRHIGKCRLPAEVYASLQEETSLWLHASAEVRVKRLLEDYPAVEQCRDQFRGPIQALRRRLGGERVARLLALLDEGDWENLAGELMLYYYDPLYRHTLPQRRIEIEVEDEEAALPAVEKAIQTVLVEPRRTGA
ncbi:tRNA 2-selenouridine(34) synthase MnmH [Geoalkalibacter subterraneus]|uniref:tRNA 2-selenouridine(34) synthase MnmH n=1 Tax=Geoalkalibacter subterraneus TaxID=483547 RepID=UPI0006935FDD|nr:tRNA 2-selenouridine(34) synthase MnmH [Geoalkalibacter subterraneus]